MAITRARTSSVAQGPSTSKSFLANNPVILGGSYESIQTVNVGSGGQSTVTFSSIPSTYTHLQIRSIARSNRTSQTFDDIRLKINNDTSTTFRHHALYGEGAGSATVDTSGANVYVLGAWGAGMAGAAATTNNFAASIIDILDYANTNKNKTIRGLDGLDNNGSGLVALSSSLWTSTTAITSIEISAIGSTIQQYSSFALYGIK